MKLNSEQKSAIKAVKAELFKEYGKLRIYTQVYVHETGKWHAKKCYAFIWRKNK